MKKLRILAASDLHGDSKLTRRLADRAEAEAVDLVVLCGDLTGRIETKDLIKPFKEKNQKVLLLNGNWDSLATVDFLANFYGVKNMHGYSVRYEHVGFFGAGGASVGPNITSEKELKEAIEKAYLGLKGVEKKVMLTHMHPLGSHSEISGFRGSKAIREAIEKFKPDILLHGHIHETFGFEELIGKTRVLNVGREGRILEI